MTDNEKSNPAEAVKTPAGAQPSNGPKPSKEDVAAREKRKLEGEEAPSVRVRIRKNETTTIPRRVFEHEIPILHALFGDDAVKAIEGTELNQPVGSAQQEFDRLLRVYGSKGEKAVRSIYPSASDLADEAGIERPERRKRSAGGQRLEQNSSHRGSGVV